MASQPVESNPGTENGRVLSWGKRIAYSVGNCGVGMLPAVVGSWAMYYYAPPPDDGTLKPYIPLSIVGIVLFLGRLAEALINPFIGYWSDKTRSRLGRRIPYILIGTPIMVTAFVFLWYPIVLRESMINAVYVAFLAIVTHSMFAIVVAPYLSLLPELTPYNNERIVVSSVMGVFEILGTLAAVAGAGVLINLYKGGIGGAGPTGFNGFKLAGLLVGGLTFSAFYATGLLVRERPYTEAKAVKFKFMESAVSALRNPSFPPYLAVVVAIRLALDTVIVVIPYIVTTVMSGTEMDAATMQMGIMVLAVLLFPLVNRWSEKAGKKKVMIQGTLGFVILLPLTATVGKWPFFSPLVQGSIVFLLASLPVAVISVLQRPLIADIIDHDETLSGYRREALYNGMEGLFTRSASGLAWVVASLLFAFFGNSAENPLGILLCGPVAGAILVVGILLFRKYPFSR
jgi:glycoside/pentoside/hexuronide:cation symporter, GPH family